MTRVVADDLTGRLERLRHALEHDTSSLSSDTSNYGHAIRLAIRRARAAIKASSPQLGAALTRALIDDLRWLSRLIGAVRDLDCTAAALRRDCPPEEWEHLMPVLAAERAAAVAQVLQALSSDRMQSLRHKIDMSLEICSAGQSEARPHAVARRAKRLLGRVLAHAAMHNPEPPERLHELRKLIKNLRYTLEMLPPPSTEPWIDAVTTELHHLQDWLGEIQDLTVLHATLSQVRQSAAQPGSALDTFLAARIEGTSQARDALIQRVSDALSPLTQLIERVHLADRLTLLAER